MADLGSLRHEGIGHGGMQAERAMKASLARLRARAHHEHGTPLGYEPRRLPPLLQFLKLLFGGLAFASVLLFVAFHDRMP